MLGNDQYGDCVWAGAAHETMLWNAERGKTVVFDATHVLGDYSKVTGFNPHDPNSDQGTDVHQALNYRRRTGVADQTAVRHKLGAYVALTPGSWTQLLSACYVFSAVGIGIQFPESAMAQFNAGKPWTPVAGSQIEGGHYVPVVGRPTSSYVDVVTWGKVQRMSASFYEKYCDEAYAILSTEMLDAGKTLEGFDLGQLQADLAAIPKG